MGTFPLPSVSSDDIWTSCCISRAASCPGWQRKETSGWYLLVKMGGGKQGWHEKLEWEGVLARSFFLWYAD